MLGPQGIVSVAAHGEPSRDARRGPHRGPLRRTLIRQQRIRDVVHKHGHRERVDGLQRNRFHRAVDAHRRFSSWPSAALVMRFSTRRTMEVPTGEEATVAQGQDCRIVVEHVL